MISKSKNKSPQISVIIPFFNRIDLLFETMGSIVSQTFTDFEVLLIDDGSEPQNITFLREKLKVYNDPRFKLLFKPSDMAKGANSSRMFGFAASKGHLVKWFDSDDVMLPNFLELQHEALVSNNLDGVISNGGVYNNDFSVLIKQNWRPMFFSDRPLEDYLKTKLAWPTPAGLWRKDSIFSINPFSQDLKNGQEWVFNLYILTSNLRIGILELDLFKIRSHDNSIRSNKSGQYWINRLKARSIALGRLIETRNQGKFYILKSIGAMFRKISKRDYFLALRVITRTMKIKSLGERASADLILLDTKKS